MKRVVFLVVALMFFLSTVSAEIIFDEQPHEVYNLGDVVKIPVTIKATEDISGTFSMTLICGAKQTNFYENGVDLKTGEEDKHVAILAKDKIGFQTGECRIKASLNGDYVFTEYFQVSNLLTIQSKLDVIEYKPGESLIVKGNVFRQTGADANGFISLKVLSGNDSTIERLSTITNGYFSINVTLPENMKAGNHLVQLNAYEVNSEEVQTNIGFLNYNIAVLQVPTNLEVFIENKEVEPGSILRAKAILHDQTGEEIFADSIMTIKKSKNEIVEQVDVPTGEFFELEIPYDEPPANWTVVAVSTLLDSSDMFTILEKKAVDISVANGTVLITNVGNVPYNDSVVIKIGDNSSLEFNVFLEVDESSKYELRAPDGEYFVEIISDGESQFGENVLLTGRAIDVKELGGSGRGFVKVLVWIFLIFVLGFVAFVLFKRGYKKSFFGSKKKLKISDSESKKISSKKNLGNLIKTSNRAILSLSIKGEKHPASIVCLKIKNMKDLNRVGIEDTMKKISSAAESRKAMIYENQENIFFIFSALKTKTFKNEKNAIELSEEIVNILRHHNRLFRHKIGYGVSVNFGELVAKVNHVGELEFMAMGNLIANSKKLSEYFSGDVLLSKEFKDKAGGMIKTQEKEIDGKKIYRIIEIRDRDQHKKFLANFLHGLEKDKAEREKRETKN